MADDRKLLNSLKSYDWRSLQKYASAQAAEDFNHFLEKLPQNASRTVLIMAGIAWAVAGVTGLFVTIEMKKLTQLRATLQEAKALKPIVPIIKETPVPPEELSEFVDKMGKIYQGVSIKTNGSSILITAANTMAFGQFREAIGHVQNGGSGWRVTVDRLCVGRECEREPLGVSLNISRISVDKPG